jgi:HEAT repeat protein
VQYWASRQLVRAVATGNFDQTDVRLASITSAQSSNRAVPDLVVCLQSKDQKIRVCAAWALRQLAQQFGADAALPALVTALKDDDFEVRKDAAAALQFFGPKARAAIPYLIENLEHPGLVRAYAVSALGRIGPDSRVAVPSLLRILPDEQGSGLDIVIKDALARIDPEASANSTEK